MTDKIKQDISIGANLKRLRKTPNYRRNRFPPNWILWGFPPAGKLFR